MKRWLSGWNWHNIAVILSVLLFSGICWAGIILLIIAVVR